MERFAVKLNVYARNILEYILTNERGKVDLMKGNIATSKNEDIRQCKLFF